jgi:phosphotransferase system enzyme I (PtsI)
MTIDAYAEKVDYFSIGTNDLTQYGLAVDRGNERVTEVYSHYDPAIIKMIKTIVDGGRKANIPVSVCGEMASEQRALVLFSAMKINGLSVAPRYIGEVRDRINKCDQKKAEEHLETILKLTTRREIIEYLDKIMECY